MAHFSQTYVRYLIWTEEFTYLIEVLLHSSIRLKDWR